MPASSDKSYKPLLFITSVFILLLGGSVFAPQQSQSALRKMDFLADLRPAPRNHARPSPKPAPTLVAAARSTVRKDSAVGTKPAAAVKDFETYNGLVTYEAERDVALGRFIKALRELKEGRRKKVRIAWFGDSIIEGDLISMNLRKQLQDTFGGAGVGFVPITSVAAADRVTVNHHFSGNWIDRSFRNAASDTGLYLSGHSFLPNGTASVTYKAPAFPHLENFYEAALFYGPSPQPQTVRANGVPVTLPVGGACSKLVVATDCKQLELQASASVPLYGLSFEASDGVYIDNYSFRGSTGLELAHLRRGMLAQLQAVHDYDLIIFQYGPNLMEPDAVGFDWYVGPMHRILDKFKTAFPNASLLVVSAGDMAYRYEGEWATARGVEALVAAQNEIAAGTEANFWNLYRAMGGSNSMQTWADEKTPLAKQDHMHFTYPGARKVAGMLYTEIMKEYARAH